MNRGRFTDTKLQRREFCDELCLKVNIGQLCVDVELKGTASYFDGIKCANIKVTDWEGKLQNSNSITTRQSNTTHIL